MTVAARGAAGPRSRLGAFTEPLLEVRLQLAAGRNLDVITQGRIDIHRSGLRRDLGRLTLAIHLAEIVDAGTGDRQPLPALWDLLSAGLCGLESAEEPELICRAFELQALGILGYWPQLTHCAGHGELLAPQANAYHPVRGGILCPECAGAAPGVIRLSAQGLAALRRMERARLSDLAGVRLSPGVRVELRRCLVPTLRYHLDLPLRALTTLDALLSDPSEPSPPPSRPQQ